MIPYKIIHIIRTNQHFKSNVIQHYMLRRTSRVNLKTKRHFRTSNYGYLIKKLSEYYKSIFDKMIEIFFYIFYFMIIILQ